MLKAEKDKQNNMTTASRRLTGKQERFAREYVENGGIASDAYKVAYDTDTMQPRTIGEEAYRMTIHHGVSMRIDELREAYYFLENPKRSTLTGKLFAIATKAEADGNASLLRKVVMDIAKLNGLIIERQQVDNTHTYPEMKDVVIDGKTLTFNIGDAMARDAVVDAEVVDVTPTAP